MNCTVSEQWKCLKAEGRSRWGFPFLPIPPRTQPSPCTQAGRGWDAGPGKHGTELLGKEWRAGGSHVGCRKSPGTPAKIDETAPWMGQLPMESRLQRDEVSSSKPGAISGRSKSTAHEMGKCWNCFFLEYLY